MRADYLPFGTCSTPGEALPRCVDALRTVDVVRVACGGHTCVLSAYGELFTFGNGKHGLEQMQ